MKTLSNWHVFIEQLFETAAAYLDVRGDRLHTQVAHRWAVALLAEEGGDREIVEPAVILHDVGWSAVDPGTISAAFGVRAEGKAEAQRMNRVHEIQGAAIAGRLLRSLDYDERRTRRILEIIERHDSGSAAESLEERLVKDADKLWRYSEEGFWGEIERQAVDPLFFRKRLARRRREWFLTTTAIRMAGEELIRRSRELEERFPSPP